MEKKDVPQDRCHRCVWTCSFRPLLSKLQCCLTHHQLVVFFFFAQNHHVHSFSNTQTPTDGSKTRQPQHTKHTSSPKPKVFQDTAQPRASQLSTSQIGLYEDVLMNMLAFHVYGHDSNENATNIVQHVRTCYIDTCETTWSDKKSDYDFLCYAKSNSSRSNTSRCFEKPHRCNINFTTTI